MCLKGTDLVCLKPVVESGCLIPYEYCISMVCRASSTLVCLEISISGVCLNLVRGPSQVRVAPSEAFSY